MNAELATKATAKLADMGTDAAFGMIPGGEAIQMLIDAAVKAATSFTGVEGPTGNQVVVFVGLLSNPITAAPLVASIVYDWWRDDGFAGGDTLKYLHTATQGAGWPVPAQVALSYYWFSAVAAMPGKGGWKGKHFWKSKLVSIQNGQPTTVYIQMIGAQNIRKDWTKPAIKYTNPIANAIVAGKPSAWQSYADSEGLAKAVGPEGAPPLTADEQLSMVKSLTNGDKINTLYGARLILSGQTDQLAGYVESSFDTISADDSIAAGGGTIQTDGLVRLTSQSDLKAAEGGGNNGLMIAAAIAAAVLVARK